jgi:MYXO-CTERM domain-containing protein
MVAALTAALVATTEPARANFHFWEVAEVYSNADGSIQYIEFATSSSGQGVLAAHVVRATSDGVEQNFTIPANLVGSTTNKRFLVATPGFANLAGAVTPDYVLPCGPFFAPGATSIEIALVGADSLTFAGTSLPTDGTNALFATDAGVLSTGTNAPTNFASSNGSLSLTACQIAGTCEPCDDGLYCNGAEGCANSACVATSPCGSLCDEEADTCVECFDVGDCNDGEICTADACNAGVCEYTAVPGNCDDGQFCTTFDMCAGGTCSGGFMTPCGDENCNEDGDYCGECQFASDCEDGDPCTTHSCDAGRCGIGEAADGAPCADNGVFCDGAETCLAGSCQSAGAACNPELQTCNEDDDVCVPIPEPGAAGGVAALLALAAIARRRRLDPLL